MIRPSRDSDMVAGADEADRDEYRRDRQHDIDEEPTGIAGITERAGKQAQQWGDHEAAERAEPADQAGGAARPRAGRISAPS